MPASLQRNSPPDPRSVLTLFIIVKTPDVLTKISAPAAVVEGTSIINVPVTVTDPANDSVVKWLSSPEVQLAPAVEDSVPVVAPVRV